MGLKTYADVRDALQRLVQDMESGTDDWEQIAKTLDDARSFARKQVKLRQKLQNA